MTQRRGLASGARYVCAKPIARRHASEAGLWVESVHTSQLPPWINQPPPPCSLRAAMPPIVPGRNPLFRPARVYGCGYCAAHCAAMGTIWFGDSVYLDKNVASMDPSEPHEETFSPKERAAISLGRKLAGIPCQLTTADIRSLASVLKPREQEALTNTIAVMGYLTRFM